MGVPLPLLADELGAAVVAVLGPVAVDVTVADVETPPRSPRPRRSRLDSDDVVSRAPRGRTGV